MGGDQTTIQERLPLGRAIASTGCAASARSRARPDVERQTSRHGRPISTICSRPTAFAGAGVLGTSTRLFSIYPPCRDISSRSQCCTPGRRERGSADKEAALEEAVGYAGAQVPAGQERNLEVADGTGNRHSRSVHAEKNNRERPIAESPMTAFFRTNRQTWFNTKCTSDEVRLCGAQRCRSRSPRSVSTRPMASDEALELVSRGRPKRFVHLEANANTECFEWCPTVLVRVLRLLHPPSTSRAASRSRMRRGVL